ncbi:MAG: hypothetical protein E6Q97_38440 [Desulfurellales bacterium]|nr:MAG: hypothetical protein E6Q97_38440 [Desulfurellales bacterium]
MLRSHVTPGDFDLIISSHGSTRPAATFGASVTPGNNTKGAWAQLLTATSDAAYGIMVNINSIAATATAKDAIIDIGIDPAGGTTYAVLLPDLLGSCASPYNVGGGVRYYFPVYVPAGATVAARASVNNATVGTARVNVSLFCRPRRPELLKFGHSVQALGITAGTSSGTTITAGTTAEGAWTSVGTLSNDAWWFQVGYGINDTTMTAAALHVDVAADNAGKRILIANSLVITTAAEQLSKLLPDNPVAQPAVASGTTIYARAQSSAAVDSANSVAVYAVT